MAEIGIRQVLVSDALNETTRKERRNLLATSLIGIIMVKTRFLPSKISALGLEFTSADQSTIILIMAIITTYFIIAFIIYSISDILSWLLKYQLVTTKPERDKSNPQQIMTLANTLISNNDNIVDEIDISKYGRKLSILSKPVSLIRISFDIILPIFIGCYAIFCLIKFQ